MWVHQSDGCHTTTLQHPTRQVYPCGVSAALSSSPHPPLCRLCTPHQGLVVTALGTAAFRATRRRALSSLALCRGKDLLVFNAGGLSEDAGVG